MSTPKRILIADDDAAILDVLTLILEDGGYQAVAAATEREMRAALADDPDLVLLDVRLSGLDGRDICRELRTDPATRDIPIVLISASNRAENVARECGADDFIAKPFEMDDLLAVVARVIDQHPATSGDVDRSHEFGCQAPEEQSRGHGLNAGSSSRDANEKKPF